MRKKELYHLIQLLFYVITPFSVIPGVSTYFLFIFCFSNNISLYLDHRFRFWDIEMICVAISQK